MEKIDQSPILGGFQHKFSHEIFLGIKHQFTTLLVVICQCGIQNYHTWLVISSTFDFQPYLKLLIYGTIFTHIYIYIYLFIYIYIYLFIYISIY